MRMYTSECRWSLLVHSLSPRECRCLIRKECRCSYWRFFILSANLAEWNLSTTVHRVVSPFLSCAQEKPVVNNPTSQLGGEIRRNQDSELQIWSIQGVLA